LGYAAGAQTVAPPPGPGERARTEFEPVGGRIGSFMLYPRVEAQIEYNDNILAAAEAARGDAIITAAPGFRLNSLWLRHKLLLDAQVSHHAYVKSRSENALEGSARLEGTIDLARDSALRLSAAAEFLAEERYSINNLNRSDDRTRFSRLSTSASYTHDLDPLVITGELYFSRLDFHDVTTRGGASLDQDFRDTAFVSGTVRGSYRVSPAVSAVVRLNVDRLEQASAGVAGTRLDRDSTGFKLEGGVGLELSRLLFGDLRLGILRRTSEDARLPNVTGLSIGASLTWTPTSLTTVRFYADRAVEEGGAVETAGNLRSEARLRVDHELRRWLILGAAVRYAFIEPIGTLPDAHEYDGELSATYLLSRRLRVIAKYRHFRRDASGIFASFNQNRSSLALKLTL
jgi:hypothetical protein